MADSYENIPQLERAISLKVSPLFLGQLIPNDCSMQGDKCQAPIPQSETTVQDHLLQSVQWDWEPLGLSMAVHPLASAQFFIFYSPSAILYFKNLIVI